MDETTDTRLEILSRCPGMDPACAAALLKSLPLLGRVPTAVILTHAGLEAPHPRLHAGVLRTLSRACVAVLTEQQDSRLRTLLMRLRQAHPEDSARLCFAALLRHYNQALRPRRPVQVL